MRTFLPALVLLSGCFAPASWLSDTDIADTGLLDDTAECDTDTDTDADTDTDSDADADTDSDTDADTDVTDYNLMVQVDVPRQSDADGILHYLDYEVVSDVVNLGTISSELWEDRASAYSEDGTVTFLLNVPDDSIAFRGDVDFPSGGNTCEGYDPGVLQTSIRIYFNGYAETVEPWDFSWQADGVTYSGCSFAALDM